MRNSSSRLAVAAAIASMASFSVSADTTFVTDQGHTEIMFGWSHVGVTNQNGEFTKALSLIHI